VGRLYLLFVRIAGLGGMGVGDVGGLKGRGDGSREGGADIWGERLNQEMRGGIGGLKAEREYGALGLVDDFG